MTDESPTSDERPVRILTVCTFNRARSAAMTAFLSRGLEVRGIDAVVMGAGFKEADREATPEVVEAMRNLDYDLRDHRSRTVSKPMVHGADLIVTAERIHVMRICEDDTSAFARTFTLPEFVLRAEQAGGRDGRPVSEWLPAVGAERTPATFIASSAREISDPTGLAPETVAATMVEIRDWCRRLVRLL